MSILRFPDRRHPDAGLWLLVVVVAIATYLGAALLNLIAPIETPVSAQRVQFRDAIACDQSEKLSTAAIGTTQIVGLTAGQRINACGFVLSGGGATTAKFVRGTGANCASGTNDVTHPFELGDNVSLPFGNGVGTVFRLPAGEALCVVNSAAVQLTVHLVYSKF
jgi:hypothetical protein